jgi:hypothetical protein
MADLLTILALRALLNKMDSFVRIHTAQFANVVDSNIPFQKYWNFLKRQSIVTDTYSTDFNRSMVHSFLWLICSSVYLLVIWIGVIPIAGVWRFWRAGVQNDFSNGT